MTVKFALFLSPEGIALAHRQPAGHWAFIGETPVDIDDLSGALAGLHEKAAAREGEDVACLVVLPDDQVLYTSVMAPTADPVLTVARIENALDGLTPYPLSELVYDFRAAEPDLVKLAVVAKETLDEARGFAESHGFAAAAYAAMPPTERFPGVPLFSPEVDLALEGDALVFGRDTWKPPAPEPEPEPEVVPAEPEVAAADPAPVSASGTDMGGGEAALRPVADPALSAPVARNLDMVEDDLTGTDTDTKTDSDTDGEAAEGPAPEISFSGRRRKRSAAQEDGGPGRIVSERPSRLGFGRGPIPTPADPVLHPDAADPTPSPQPEPQSGLAGRLARVRDVSKPRAPAPAPPAAKPAAPPIARAPGGAAAPDAPARAPLAPPPKPGAPGAKPLRPLAPAAPAFTSGAISDAFDRAPFPPPPPQRRAPGAGLVAGAVARLSSALPSAGAVTALPSRIGAGLQRLKPAIALPGRAKPAAAVPAENPDEKLIAGLMEVNSKRQPAGGTFKTGLILTVILLILLALVAVWSVLFLPNSPIARLLTGGDRSVAEAPGALPDPDMPPMAITAPPAIGTLDPGTPLPEAAGPPADLALEGAEVAALAETGAAPADDAVLPDIDAELDLPPLPPLPEDLLPPLEEAVLLYARDGIWMMPPDRPDLAPISLVEDIYVASIDPEVIGHDALALPPADVNPAEVPRAMPAPLPFGTELDLNAQGLVEPTADGVVTPSGAFVISGQPPLPAVRNPRAPEAEDEARAQSGDLPEINVLDAVLGTFRPPARPGDLSELRERQILGGLTETELALLRPAERPLSAQEAAAQASLFTDDQAPGDDAAIGSDVTELAVARSVLPAQRPADIEAIVASAARTPAAEATTQTAAVTPGIPSNADVSRAATQRNEIRLRNVNLIGVSGTPQNRRAMVRLPSGRFVQVSVGDRLDGGRVAAIGEASLQYVRNGRNITLEIPG